MILSLRTNGNKLENTVPNTGDAAVFMSCGQARFSGVLKDLCTEHSF